MSTGTVMTVTRLGFAESEMLDFSYARTLAYAGYRAAPIAGVLYVASTIADQGGNRDA